MAGKKKAKRGRPRKDATPAPIKKKAGKKKAGRKAKDDVTYMVMDAEHPINVLGSFKNLDAACAAIDLQEELHKTLQTKHREVSDAEIESMAHDDDAPIHPEPLTQFDWTIVAYKAGW